MGIKEEVALALESGVAPISMVKDTVLALPRKKPMAYRAKLQINSLDLGTLTAKEYQVTADRTKRAILLAGRALTYAFRAIEEKLAQAQEFEWISVRCPDTMLVKTDFAKTLDRLCEEKTELCEKLCLEFSPAILYNADEKVKESLLQAKARGAKILLDSFGDAYCPAMKLAEFPFDYVVMHPVLVEMLQDPQRYKVAQSLLAYVKVLGMQVIAPETDCEEVVSACERAGCAGYTVASSSEPL